MALPATQLPTIDLIRELTYDDLVAMPEDGHRYELISGEIVMSPAPKTVHQRIVRRLVLAIENLNTAGAVGETFFAPLDVKLSNHNVVQPDLIFVAADRAHIVGEDFVDGAPDFVVEVLSPSNREDDLVRKAAIYADFGVAEYWVVDPDGKRVIVNRLDSGRYQRTSFESGDAQSTVIPGLTVTLSALFG